LKLAAIILGVVGGVAGVLSSLFVLLLPEEIEYFAGLDTDTLIGLVIVAIVASVIGIAGGVVAISRPGTAGLGWKPGISARSASRRRANAEVITLAPEEKELIEKEKKRTG